MRSDHPGAAQLRRKDLRKRIKNDRLLYLMLLPAIIWYILFCYIPMGGIVLAFKNFRYDMGVLMSPWNGLENFRQMFSDPDFLRALKNTLIISFGKLLFLFPIPILVAVTLNELQSKRMRRFFQTVFTFPHFISWVVLAIIFTNLFSNYGLVNQLLQHFDLPTISPLSNPKLFRPFLWISAGWKEFGWDAVIYLAALASVDPQYYEAARVDGASRWSQLIHITLPGIMPTIVVMLIMRIGNLMQAGFEQIFVLYNPGVYGVADIIDTYVYRMGLQDGMFELSTAVGLFKSVINFILIVGANRLARHAGEEGVY